MNLRELPGRLKQRFPPWNEILAVYAFIVFAVFSWDIYTFLYYVPSRLLNVGLGGILILFFFQMAFALLESLLVCALMLLLCFLLPGRWLRDSFGTSGFLITVAGASLSLLSVRFTSYPLPPAFWAVIAACVIVLLASIIILNKFPKIQKGLLSFVKRFGIFTYIYVPLGAIGILIFIARNLF